MTAKKPKPPHVYVVERFWPMQGAWIPIFDRPHMVRKDAVEVMWSERELCPFIKFRISKYVRAEK